MEKNDDLFDMAKTSPLDAAKECRSRVFFTDQGYRQELYSHIVCAYAIAYALRRDQRSWRAFAADPFWKAFKKRPKSTGSKRTLLNVMVYVFDGTSKSTYNRAQKYAAALTDHFNRGVKPGEIRALIEKDGGLEAMAREAAMERRKERDRKADEDFFKLKEYVKDVPSAGQDADNEGLPPAEETTKKHFVATHKKKSLETGRKKRGLKIYDFIASKVCGPRIRLLSEGQKARITIEMVARPTGLLPKVISVKSL